MTMKNLIFSSLALAMALTFVPAAPAAAQSADWAGSPEAYFLTRSERDEWSRLRTDAERDEFIERYWLKRDPTPFTARNEFQEMVRGRIAQADQRYAIAETPGSRTGRGKVFVIFGPPSRERNVVAGFATPGQPREAIDSEVGESTSIWTYEKDRTPQILEVLGRSTLEVKILIQPQRRRDRILDPGMINPLIETVAEKSIVNPDLARGAAEPAADGRFVASSLEPLRDGEGPARPPADSSPAAGASSDHAIVWGPEGNATLFVWFHLPQQIAATDTVILATLEDEEGNQRRLTAAARPSEGFSAPSGGRVVAGSIDLPPGRYRGAVELIERASGRLLAREQRLFALPSLDRGFAVSSLVVAAEPLAAGTDEFPFRFGEVETLPRADAVFRTSESLWYFYSVAHPSAKENVTMQVRLHLDGKPSAALEKFTPSLWPVAEGRFIAAYEMPLRDLTPGEYALYVVIRDEGGDEPQQETRRSDFTLVKQD
jgi:GWxTD domain-containing protein